MPYRGYLQKQFLALTGNIPVGIIIPALVFTAARAYQGLIRALLVGVMGGMAGTLAYWCRTVRPGMLAHILQDVMGGLVRQ